MDSNERSESRPSFESLHAIADPDCEGRSVVTKTVRECYYQVLLKVFTEVFPAPEFKFSSVEMFAQEYELLALKKCMDSRIYRAEMLAQITALKRRLKSDPQTDTTSLYDNSNSNSSDVKDNISDCITQDASHDLINAPTTTLCNSESSGNFVSESKSNINCLIDNKSTCNLKVKRTVSPENASRSLKRSKSVPSNAKCSTEQVSVKSVDSKNKVQAELCSDIAEPESQSSVMQKIMEEMEMIFNGSSTGTNINEGMESASTKAAMEPDKLIGPPDSSNHISVPFIRIGKRINGYETTYEEDIAANKKSSFWKTEEFVQRCLQKQCMYYMRTINPEKYAERCPLTLHSKFATLPSASWEVKLKLNSLFNSDHESDSFEDDYINFKALKHACTIRVTYVVISCLTKYFKKSRIRSRSLFKVFSKSLVQKLLTVNPYIEIRVICESIDSVFSGKAFVIDRLDDAQHVEKNIVDLAMHISESCDK